MISQVLRRCLGRVTLRALCTGVLLSIAATSAGAQDLTLFAAASLREALTEIVAHYDASARTKTRVSFASSAALAQQIEQGAPADIYISADVAWMDHLASRKLIDAASRVDLLRNRLVLVAAADSALQLRIGKGFELARALGGARLAIAHPDSVPAGRYARAALAHLAVWQSVSDRLARTDNVRAALALVARGEAPLGIVYATDAKAEPKVRVIDVFPQAAHPPIVYPAALVAGARATGAPGLLRFLQSAEARATWLKHGFLAR